MRLGSLPSLLWDSASPSMEQSLFMPLVLHYLYPNLQTGLLGLRLSLAVNRTSAAGGVRSRFASPDAPVPAAPSQDAVALLSWPPVLSTDPEACSEQTLYTAVAGLGGG